MAELVLKDCFYRVGPSSDASLVNLSTTVRSVTINYAAELHDRTYMTADSRLRLAGLKDWSFDVEHNQDFASTDVDKFHFDSIGSTQRWIQVRPTTANASASNPIFEGPCLLESYPPLGGAAGDLGTFSVTWQGDGNLSRNVST